MESSHERSPQKPYYHISAPLPPFDKAVGTKKWCIIGLIFCYILSIAFICTGLAFWAHMHGDKDADPVYRYYPARAVQTRASLEIILLTLNISVTLATECVGYIHATSLRWALYHEGRLWHNSNLRLFTSARLSMPNRWFVNALWFLLITISYSCASQLLILPTGYGFVVISSLGLIILGCCLLVCLLAMYMICAKNSLI
jgi:hypothetical protein